MNRRAPTRIGRISRKRAQALGWMLLSWVVLHGGFLLWMECVPRLRDPLFGDRLHSLRTALRETEHSQPALILMLGSSRTANGFNARLLGRSIENQTDRSFLAFNYGIFGSGPVTQLVFLKRLTAAGIRPDLLLIEVYPMLLVDEGTLPAEAEWLKPDRLYPSEAELAARYGFSESAIRASYRDALANPFGTLHFQLMSRLRPTWVPSGIGYYWNRQADARGWLELPESKLSLAERIHIGSQTGKGIGIAYANSQFGGPAVRALRDLLTLGRNEGIEARLVLMPESSHFRSWTPHDVEDRLQLLRDELTRDSGVPWIDARLWVGDEHFHDGHHLLSSGATIFTRRLASEIMPAVAAKPAH